MGTTKVTRKKGGMTERAFSIDLQSSDAVRAVSLGNPRDNAVTIEGTVGILKPAGFVENSVLEVAGAKGVLRIDLTSEDLSKSFPETSGE